jgi:glutamyl-tRNA synthetase
MSVRFAPSPTGRFHVGNLRTAWLSHWIARKLRMTWVVRFEDIDQPRVIPGARQTQLEDMAALGLMPEEVRDQSQHHSRHWQLFSAAIQAGKAYPCFCSRKDLQRLVNQSASAPHDVSPTYDGFCRSRRDWPLKIAPSVGWRFRSEDPSGAQDWLIGRTTGTVLKKDCLPAASDFIPSYNWACALDDYDGRHRLLVRAADLAHVLPLQREAQNWMAHLENPKLGWVPPAVLHSALVTLPDGGRLEKRTQGITLPELRSRGVSLEQLLSAFENSLDPSLKQISAPIGPGAVMSETPAQVSLHSLGLPL